MKVTDIGQIKRNSRIQGDEEDDVLEQIGDTAEAIIENMMNRTFEDVCIEYGEIPAPLVRATLILCDHLFTHRGPTSPTTLYNIPYSIDVMVKPYTKLGT